MTLRLHNPQQRMPSEEIEKISLDLLFEYATQLPTSPKIFARLSQLVSKEDTSLDYISSLVRMDPALAAHVLRVTNSAFYGASVKIYEISTAISRIGFTELKGILNSIVENDSFFQAVPAYGLTATEFSDNALDVAIASETVAKRVGFDPTVPYLTGLLHKIGQLTINVYMERLEKVVDLTEKAGKTPLIEFERQTLGMSHYRVGSELLSRWKFEATIWQPIRNQNSPLHAQSQPNTSAILTLAIWIVEQIANYDPEATYPDAIKAALRTLKIDALDVASLLDESRFEINDRKNMLAMLL